MRRDRTGCGFHPGVFFYTREARPGQACKGCDEKQAAGSHADQGHVACAGQSRASMGACCMNNVSTNDYETSNPLFQSPANKTRYRNIG